MRSHQAEELDELAMVTSRRFDEAYAAGFSSGDACRFAESTIDIGLLRKLAAAGCPGPTIARIIL